MFRTNHRLHRQDSGSSSLHRQDKRSLCLEQTIVCSDRTRGVLVQNKQQFAQIGQGEFLFRTNNSLLRQDKRSSCLEQTIVCSDRTRGVLVQNINSLHRQDKRSLCLGETTIYTEPISVIFGHRVFFLLVNLRQRKLGDLNACMEQHRLISTVHECLIAIYLPLNEGIV